MAKKKSKGRRKARTYISNPAPRKSTRTITHLAHRFAQRASAAGKRLRSYRRNPSPLMAETGMLLAGGAAGAILVPKAVSMIPMGSNLIKNVGMAVAGAGVAYFGHKKRSHLVLGLGLGTAVAGVTRAITNAVPALAGDGEYSQDEQHSISADLMGDDGENLDYMGAPAVMGAPAAVMGADPFTNTMF